MHVVETQAMQVLEHLAVARRNGHALFVCNRCDAELGPADTNYKRHCLYRERPVQEIGRLFGDPRRFVDDDIVFREFLCPNCGGLFDTEINRRSEPPVHDIDVRPEQ
jgi:acetone carboxylase gamma subunit